MAEIELISLRLAGDRTLEVAYDDQSTWPFAWYLRDYPRARSYGAAPTPADLAAPVVLVGPRNAARVEPFVRDGYVRRGYRQLWWPLQGYATMGPADVAGALADPASRAWLWQVVWHRRYPGVELSFWPLHRGFAMYVRREVAARAWPLGPTPPAADAGRDRGAPRPGE
jgi:hypothetical protein